MGGALLYKPKNGRIPNEIFELARKLDVYVTDTATGELIQLLDLCEEEVPNCEPDSLI